MLDGKKNFKVLKSVLLETIKKNREKHIETFNQAKKAYRDAAITALQTQLEKARTGEKFSLNFSKMPKPCSYQKEYDKVIGLLELSMEDVSEITSTDFTQYILDEWHWQASFRASNSTYGVGAPAEAEDD
jgi:hypothetical protein